MTTELRIFTRLIDARLAKLASNLGVRRPRMLSWHWGQALWVDYARGKEADALHLAAALHDAEDLGASRETALELLSGK